MLKIEFDYSFKKMNKVHLQLRYGEEKNSNYSYPKSMNFLDEYTEIST